ncbi:helix-turn-helix domain-containing protein [Corynebacterium striatum]
MTANAVGDFITDNDVADMLNVTVYAVRHWRNAGTGPEYYRFGRFVRYPRAGVLEWAQQQCVSSGAQRKAG